MTTALRNSDRFLIAFNRINHTLRDIVGAKDFQPFYRLVDQGKKKNALVRKYEDDLRSFADLRNAIVHHRTSMEFVIAEPHSKIVNRIEHIDHTLAKPKLVGQVFQKKVLSLQTTDSLKYALNIIRQKKFTQFPVFEGPHFRGLVTTVGITNWLATTIAGSHASITMPTLHDILHHEKNRVNYKFISRYITIYDAEEIFKQGVERGKRFEALLITEHGKPHQKLLGIVTPIDIMKVD
ncbi:CBS domain-containing protein [Lysinibacillus antri]|uniref:CBS domain-containing protein n=1 Tax=Lysinibacillus antri TaxID=2498145 RepID=A0A432L7J4_9BACI|nr:CBS domain-containing protein [Lysinibacillus antri]RUL47793.1 CBS domain-containing protein [Lysinibacillus antri]